MRYIYIYSYLIVVLIFHRRQMVGSDISDISQVSRLCRVATLNPLHLLGAVLFDSMYLIEERV